MLQGTQLRRICSCSLACFPCLAAQLRACIPECSLRGRRCKLLASHGAVFASLCGHTLSGCSDEQHNTAMCCLLLTAFSDVNS